jgi:hypothetical protein
MTSNVGEPSVAENARFASAVFAKAVLSSLGATSEHALTWFWSKEKAPLFSHGMVLQLAPNISATTLQNWTNREIVAPMIEGGAIRGRRFYRADQLVSIAVGSKLVDQFGLSPTDAIFRVIQANLEVVRYLMRAAVGAMSTPRVEWIEDYWVVQGHKMATGVVINQGRLGEIIKEQSNPLLVWHHGRELSDLATRARVIFDARSPTASQS